MSNKSRRAKRQRIKKHSGSSSGPRCGCGFRIRGANHTEGAHHKGEIGRVRHAGRG